MRFILKLTNMILTIKDETFSGEVLNELQIELKSETVTVKEIIESRVSQEVRDYNIKSLDKFKGLIEPSNAEKQINGYKLKKGRKLDAEKQIYVALDAFSKNGFFMLIDNLQAESLNQKVKISDKTLISFVKLTPLIGG